MPKLWSPWTAFLDAVSSKLAFYPPNPPTYKVVTTSGRARMHPDTCPSTAYDVYRVPTPRGNLTTVMLPYQDGSGPVMLFSHGNAVDLGVMMPFFADLVSLLHVTVCSYDYTGYGDSSGSSPSVSATLQDIQAVYNWLRTTHGKQPSDIVLYGQSVGSGPSVHLAASTPDLAGLVLHSPLVSGVRVLHPEWQRWPAWADVYPNQVLMPHVQCPTLVMHGTADDVVAVCHGEQLAQLAPNAVDPLFAKGFDHQNLHCSAEYIPHLRAFLHTVGARR